MTPVGPAKTLTELVALEIRLQMVRQDVKQSQLARTIKKTEQWLSVRLRGKQPIDLNDLALIAQGLGVPVHQLLPEPTTAALASQPTTTPYVSSAERVAGQRPADNRPKKRKPERPPTTRRTSRVARAA